MLVVIGIPTYGRNDFLEDCLNSIKHQNIPKGVDIHLILLDNNQKPLAKSIFEQFYFPFESSYIHEPKKGIVVARNRILKEAIALKSELLGFIDDDEWADANWLMQGVKVLESRFEISTGPCHFQFDKAAPKWISSTRVFSTPYFKEGEFFKPSSTRNVFIKTSFFERHDLLFEMELNEIGGSDTLFFKKAMQLGGRVFWNNAQTVMETIPVERSGVNWVMKRNMRLGSAKVIRWFRLQPRYFVYLKASYQAVFSILIGLLQFIVTFWHPRLWIRGLEKFSNGVGIARTIIGVPYAEYK